MKWSVRNFIIESNGIEGYLGAKFLEGSIEYDQHIEAFEYLLSNELSEKNILITHKIMMQGLLYKSVGCYRDEQVFIMGNKKIISIPPTPHLINSLMHQWFDLCDKVKTKEDCWDRHYHFESIHPFIDGNGRMGRVLLNVMLDKLNLDKVIVEEEKKNDYYDAISSWGKENFKKYK